MTSLRDLQRKFISDCMSGELTDDNISMKDDLNPDDVISAKGRMGIYRESSLGNIMYPMELTYPVVLDLVGKDFFRQTCRKYIGKHWPVSGNMNDYGDGFADFLQGFEPVQDLLYLPDVARLEWLFHQSSLAEDAKGADWSKLSEFSPDEVTALKIALHPSVALFSSSHPVLKIWKMCQEGADKDKKLDLSQEPGESVLLVRKNLKVNLYLLSSGEMAFLEVLKAGGVLFEAFEAAMAAEDGASVQDYILKHIEIGTFSAFSAAD